MGLRLAIGANRARLLRQLLTESAVLVLAGGVSAVFVGYWISRLLLEFTSHNSRLPLEPHITATALMFTAAVSAGAILIFGLAPALFATKGDVASHLKETKTGRTKGSAQRFEKALVAVQIVLSVVLLYGSGLFIRTLQNLEKSDVGYRRENLLIAEMNPWTSGYKGAQIVPLAKNLNAALNSTPGVTSVTFSENGIFSGTESGTENAVEGFTPRTSEDTQSASDKIGPKYFSTIGVPILAGREIGEQDTATSIPVAVVNQAFANFYFPNRTAVGRHVSDPDGKNPMAIIGVVGTAKENSLREPAKRRIYIPYLQSRADDAPDGLRFEIRTQANQAAIETSLRQAIHKVDASLREPSIKWSEALIQEDLEQETLIAKLSSFFSALALILASVGLYGVMSYLTSRRTTEVGVRMALGASRSSVMALVFRDAFGMTAIGLLTGGVCAFAVGRLTANSLYGVAAFDPLTIAATSAIIAVAAGVAVWVPAQRASRVDPMVALRAE
jgi:predicted permease